MKVWRSIGAVGAAFFVAPMQRPSPYKDMPLRVIYPRQHAGEWQRRRGIYKISRK